jgi:hypothetical protein
MPSAAPSIAGPNERGPALLAVLVLATLAAACNPRVQLEAPKDPIVINLNVKIEQEVRVRIERDLEDLLDDPELFGG